MLLDIYEAWQNFFNATEEDGGNWATRLAAIASSVFAVMNAGMQQASEYMQACANIEVAKAEKKYDREIELAEGNSYRVKKAEKQKEKEIAKIKSDAAKKAVCNAGNSSRGADRNQRPERLRLGC